jgi:disulfide bond formation protein DsbB
LLLTGVLFIFFIITVAINLRIFLMLEVVLELLSCPFEVFERGGRTSGAGTGTLGGFGLKLSSSELGTVGLLMLVRWCYQLGLGIYRFSWEMSFSLDEVSN